MNEHVEQVNGDCNNDNKDNNKDNNNNDKWMSTQDVITTRSDAEDHCETHDLETWSCASRPALPKLGGGASAEAR